jgi:hypothetical protein
VTCHKSAAEGVGRAMKLPSISLELFQASKRAVARSKQRANFLELRESLYKSLCNSSEVQRDIAFCE